MERWSGRVALVTGSGSGIGEATSTALVGYGVNVVGVDVRGEKVEEVGERLKGQPGKFYPLQADISDESDVLKTFEWVKRNLGGVDILVNCAGITGNVPLTGPLDRFRQILNINVIGLSLCTREALKSMKERGVEDGHIIHINSMGGHYIVNAPGVYPYLASKHAVTVLTEGLRRELVQQKSKIKITSVSPGPVDTELFRNRMKDYKGAGFAEIPLLQPKDLADGIIYVLGTPPHVQVHELSIRPVGDSI